MERSFHHIQRDQRVRDYQRRMVGAGRMEVTFQIPIQGTARSGMATSATDLLHFGLGFYPQLGEHGLLTPAFRSGFSILPAGPEFDPSIPLGYIGFANCPYFKYNSDGLCIGAICHIGVCNLGSDGNDVPFKGNVSLSFLGIASRAPLDSADHYQYTGPDSVSLLERPAQGDE